MKTLLLMRHAKSDWTADYGSDHDRPLNERGVRSARIMGRLLTDRGLEPEVIVTSSAVRARSTAELAAKAGSWHAQVRVEPELYGGGVESVVSSARIDGEHQSIMLVGHQPTWSASVFSLTGERVDMKTAAVAVMRLKTDRWPDVETGSARLEELLLPRDYFGSEFDA